MKTERLFNGMTDRYQFDFQQCTTKKGYAQIDTSQDAWYFGTWTNPSRLTIVGYAEGDITIQIAESVTEYVQELRKIKSWNEENGHSFFGIDPGFNEDLKNTFDSLDVSDLLH